MRTRARARGKAGRRRALVPLAAAAAVAVVVVLALAALAAVGLGRRAPPAAPVEGDDFDFALLVDVGLIKVKLRRSAEDAARYVDELLAQPGVSGAVSIAAATAPRANATAPADGFRFYRAEPVPPTWGDPQLPDNYFGGRWGPPYALLQGSLKPAGGLGAIAPAAADAGALARPPIVRGDVAWAGGGGCCDFFIALDRHPEWGTGHTVFGRVDEDSMRVVDDVLRRHPLVVQDWGSINATVLEAPLPFVLVAK